MSIVQAVTQAIEAGSDAWADYLPREFCGHRMHVRYATRTDAWDSRTFAQLRMVGVCHRARLTHTERADGSLRPRLIVLFGEWDGEERRIGARRGVEFRREMQEAVA